MSLRTVIGTVRRGVLSHLLSRRVPLGNAGPMVSFTFDDFPRSAYTVGAPILQRFGTRGTYYVTPGLMDQVNDLGEHYSLQDLQNLVKQGHELASHTYSHLSCREVSLYSFQADVRKAKRAICDQMGIADSGNFAYPYGDVTLRAKQTLGLEMLSCRGTTPGINGPEVDLNLLHANSLYGDMTQLAVVQRSILENAARKGWLIFYTHDVCSRPSRFGCIPELLEAAVSFAAQGRANIVTVAGALTKLQVQPSDLSHPLLEQANVVSRRTGPLSRDFQNQRHPDCQR
jgi:peptidoglycan/xylan/chitin deacetylase (PgdA/CDA1 family)